jgi:selenoprotein W-related protein
MAQELLTTFEADLGEVALIPSAGGVFEVRVDGDVLWSRQARGGFPGSATQVMLLFWSDCSDK